MISSHDAEIMSPVGSFASLHAAINAGAHSVYFGVTQLNMRAKSACNMTINDLREIAKMCHEKKVKAYVTVNTLLYEHDLVVMHQIVDAAKEAGIDAVIASDWAVIMYCNDICMPVHFSTQMSLSNYEAVKFASAFTNRVVLARELDLKQIKTIASQIRDKNLMGNEGRLMEIECFVHGALCIAQSGRCYMSLFSYNSSANRGACKQNCRARYKVTDAETGNELIIDNEYVMSPTDICTINFLDQLLDAGIQVFKIEGRGRSPEYVDIVTRTYRNALDDIANGTYTEEHIEAYYKALETVYNRGLSDGYYLGKPLGEWAGAHGSKATKEKRLIGKVAHYYPKAGVMEFTITTQETICVGDTLKIIGSTTGVHTEEIKEMWVNDQPAQTATQGDVVTLPVSATIREKDTVYKWIDRAHFQ